MAKHEVDFDLKENINMANRLKDTGHPYCIEAGNRLIRTTKHLEFWINKYLEVAKKLEEYERRLTND